MQNKVARLHASGVNRFRARFSQSLTDRPWVYATFNAALAGLTVAGGFFGVIFVSIRIYGRAWEPTRKRWGREARGCRKKPLAFNFPLAHRFLVQLRVSFRTAVSRTLKRIAEGKKHTQKQTISYAGYSERKECLRKTAISSHRPLFPLIYLLFFFYIYGNKSNYMSGLILQIILQRGPVLHQFYFPPYKSFVIGLPFLDASHESDSRCAYD